MKPREKKPATVFRIIDRATGKARGSYSRAYCDEYDFDSVQRARTANCHGMFNDHEKYAIAEYKVTYELINPESDTADDCPQKPELTGDELRFSQYVGKMISASFREAFGRGGPALDNGKEEV